MSWLGFYSYHRLNMVEIDIHLFQFHILIQYNQLSIDLNLKYMF